MPRECPPALLSSAVSPTPCERGGMQRPGGGHQGVFGHRYAVPLPSVRLRLQTPVEDRPSCLMEAPRVWPQLKQRSRHCRGLAIASACCVIPGQCLPGCSGGEIAAGPVCAKAVPGARYRRGVTSAAGALARHSGGRARRRRYRFLGLEPRWHGCHEPRCCSRQAVRRMPYRPWWADTHRGSADGLMWGDERPGRAFRGAAGRGGAIGRAARVRIARRRAARLRFVQLDTRSIGARNRICCSYVGRLREISGRAGRLEQVPDPVGDFALDAADGFAGALAFLAFAIEICLCLGVHRARVTPRWSPALTAVAAAIEAMAWTGPSTGSARRRRRGEPGAAAEALGAGDLANDRARGQLPETGLGEQLRRDLGDEVAISLEGLRRSARAGDELLAGDPHAHRLLGAREAPGDFVVYF